MDSLLFAIGTLSRHGVRMNLRDLRYLVAVAEHRHFGRAAEACFVSQPTLSTQLKKLEETLGVTLIERTNRQVMLTPAGEVIVRQAQVVLREVNTLTALAEQFNDPMGGELRLGIIPTLAPYLLPKIIRPLSEAFPKLHLQLTEAQTATILRMLKQGELDVILLALPLGEENVVEAEIFREPFLFAVGDAHPKQKACRPMPWTVSSCCCSRTATACAIRPWRSVTRTVPLRTSTFVPPASKRYARWWVPA